MWALEPAADGVRVNAIAPGAIRNLTQRTKDAHGGLWGLPSAGHGGVQTLGPGGYQGGITRF